MRVIPQGRRLSVASSIALLAALAVAPIPADTANAATATVTATGTAESTEAAVLSWINKDRAARGLRPLRTTARLTDLAGDRAATMAAKGILSHTIAGNLGDQLKARGLTAWAFGETIGSSTATWGTTAASRIYALWRNSAPHSAILMSSRYNYVGVGFAYRSASGTTYADVVAIESPDITAPTRSMTGASRSGTTVRWTWKGADVLLQTHTAGLRGFDVQYRSSATSTWTTLATNTTATSRSLTNRAHGRYHYLRVRARDWRGNTSSWSSALRVWVP